MVGGAAAAATMTDVPRYGGPMLTYGLRDWVSVEGGADFGDDFWRTGWGGARFTFDPRPAAKYRFAGDLESALGFGWGGAFCGDDDCEGDDGLSPYERKAGGGLLGTGVAGHFSFFAVFARARAQLTKADNVPPTLWGTIGGGIQFRIADRVDLYNQYSFAGYTNRVDQLYGAVYEIGVAVRIPTPW